MTLHESRFASSTLADLTERDWSSQVYELAKLLGWRRYHTYRSKHSAAGFPDEVLVRDRVVFLELKTEKGKPSPDQRDWLVALIQAGVEAYIARPRDLDDLADLLSTRKPPASYANALLCRTLAELKPP